MEYIDIYLHNYPEIAKVITSETEELLNILLERLTNPEPLETDVAKLISASEYLDLSLRKLNEKVSCPVNIGELWKRKDELPTKPSELVPYLTELLKDYSESNLDLISHLCVSPITKEENHKMKLNISKKLKAAPVLILRDIQHLFTGPDTEDMIKIIIKLSAITEKLLINHSTSDPTLYNNCLLNYENLEKLTPCEVKVLGINYADIILGIIFHSEEELTEISSKETTTLSRRKHKTLKSAITWDEIFKSRGIDLDGILICERIIEEQDLAKNYLDKFSDSFGGTEHKIMIKTFINRSQENMKNEDEAYKIQNYIQLRLEESKVMNNLCPKIQNFCERLTKLDLERANILKTKFNEVGILVEKNNPALKSELEVLTNREAANLSQNPENLSDYIGRLSVRLNLEKELQRIKEEANPADNSEGELVGTLAEIEKKLYQSLHSQYSLLLLFSQDLYPKDYSNLKHITELELSTTSARLFASIHSGIDSLNLLLEECNSLLNETPLRNTLQIISKLISQEAIIDDNETEIVFSGLLRLCGSMDDKLKAKKLRENRSFSYEEQNNLFNLSKAMNSNLSKFLPTRSEQSKLQAKLIKEAGNMRDGIDDIDLITEDLFSKAIRETANTLNLDDNKSRDILNGIKKSLEAINEITPTSIPEIVNKVQKRLENWEKLERLRKELRDKLSKEINRLKGEIQDKVNEIETVKASLEGMKTQYDSQLTMIQNTADRNAALVEKLTQEATEKEKELSNIRSKASQLQVENERYQEDNQRIQDEIDSSSKELRNLRRGIKDKDSEIRDLQNELDNLERSHEKGSLEDKEKIEILDKFKEEVKQLRDEILGKNKTIDELEEKCAAQDRNIQKNTVEITEYCKEQEQLRKEKSQMKSYNLKLETELNELHEQAKLNEGINPEEIKYLEKILEDKQKEIDEAEADLVVARRYKLLYSDLSVEKQETEIRLKELLIENEEFKWKLNEFKQENDQLKYKTRGADQLQKEAADLQKENQRLEMRLNFLENSSDDSKKTGELAKQLSEEISGRVAEIEELGNQIESLQEELKTHKKRYDVLLSRGFLIRLCHAFKEQEGVSFRK